MKYDDKRNNHLRRIPGGSININNHINNLTNDLHLTGAITSKQYPNNTTSPRRYSLDSSLKNKIKEFCENALFNETPKRAKDELDITIRDYAVCPRCSSTSSPHFSSKIESIKKELKTSSFCKESHPNLESRGVRYTGATFVVPKPTLTHQNNVTYHKESTNRLTSNTLKEGFYSGTLLLKNSKKHNDK